MLDGLKQLPNLENLETAYLSLIHEQPDRPKVSDLVKFSQWSRLDPRLAEIWVQYIGRHWSSLNPLELRTAVASQPWPAAVGLLLDFSQEIVEAEAKQVKVFKIWKRLIVDGIVRANDEQFFLGLRHLGGAEMLDDARLSVERYRRWGFLGRENLIPKKSSEGFVGREQRKEILSDLLAQSRRITTHQYWQELGRCISKRQAERDLRENSALRGRGRTKARYYERMAKRLPLKTKVGSS